ncbi:MULTISPECIES: ribosome biogenesis GTPase Der [Thalassospira]|jgi:GTPase|uniref:GTPase Der n=1 Tax=Thalassospira profundimaris TaxID=502049 RepID=A0A367V6W9_9PROT|nr:MULTISPECIES: ribosome biogenesis GTPase Der [Thalassospira]MBR9901709.1 ribosome biogenesis GTPase Der [Rhodospirillales bacterium]KZB70404.1 ribosome biogenesis GTPase Der [Thalassospira sp. MCCC 1A01148]MBO6808516.1 ribosome biogenesis GTPase Der [Thalassospira sp.]MBO6839786.1 ribosome biogenesis GTPase Der [Thalassospira sp.]MBS8274449.1 ribosome biogenesis GTPase Der [Thalassospira tepidiphila]|tara:strand:- start:9352 stop:10887 length:1536 start_codon:yes stop_codon:yes gene_type:complete
MSLKVAIIGRPNVGKSTLFNRLVGKKLALVDDQPGVTRDRRYGKARLGDMSFDIIDTAGLEEAFDNSVEGMMRQQSEMAFEECDVALFLIDARAGLTPLDNHFADWLRKRQKPVYVIANKHEGRDQDPGLYEAYGLGLGDVAPISAEHGLGIELLYDMLEPHWKEWKDRERVARQHAREAAQEALDEARADSLADDDFDDEDGFADDEGEVFPSYEIEFSEDDEDEDGELIVEGARDNSKIQLAIVGRPNAGKSTLLNQLLGENRVMTGPQAGLTRDSIAVDWSYDGRPIRLVDTAGMRRKKKIDDRVEKLSVADTLRVIRYAQVVVLMIDATNTLDKQDLTIARMVLEEGRALIIAVNKWDAIKDKAGVMQDLRDKLDVSFAQAKGIPVLTFSALTGRGTDRLMPTVLDIHDIWSRRIPTSQLNRWLEAVTERHLPPVISGRRIRLRYMTQAKSRPPSFFINCSKAAELPESYTRYLINGLREDFDMPGVPIRIYLRSSDNPFANKKKKR